MKNNYIEYKINNKKIEKEFDTGEELLEFMIVFPKEAELLHLSSKGSFDEKTKDGKLVWVELLAGALFSTKEDKNDN